MGICIVVEFHRERLLQMGVCIRYCQCTSMQDVYKYIHSKVLYNERHMRPPSENVIRPLTTQSTILHLNRIVSLIFFCCLFHCATLQGLSLFWQETKLNLVGDKNVIVGTPRKMAGHQNTQEGIRFQRSFLVFNNKGSAWGNPDPWKHWLAIQHSYCSSCVYRIYIEI